MAFPATEGVWKGDTLSIRYWIHSAAPSQTDRSSWGGRGGGRGDGAGNHSCRFLSHCTINMSKASLENLAHYCLISIYLANYCVNTSLHFYFPWKAAVFSLVVCNPSAVSSGFRFKLRVWLVFARASLCRWCTKMTRYPWPLTSKPSFHLLVWLFSSQYSNKIRLFRSDESVGSTAIYPNTPLPPQKKLEPRANESKPCF